MKLKPALALLAALATFATGSTAALFDKEITFSESEIQKALTKSGPQQRNYGGLATIYLIEPPQITLGAPAEHIGISARVHLSLLGQPAVPVDVTGTAGLRYNDTAKAFFLENPVAHSVQSQAIPKEYEPAARNAFNTLIASYFRSKPVYVLRQDGTPEEVAARWLLRSVRIEPGKIVATLSPL